MQSTSSPVVILVAGISCSGKTTLAAEVVQEFNALHVRMDDYYRGFDSIPLPMRKMLNFDSPDAIEHELLTQHITALKAEMPVHMPVYDAAKFERLGTHLVQSRPVIVVEGLFALCWPELNALATAKIFVDTPCEVCLERRLFRDTVEFNRSRDDSLRRYHEHVQPNQQLYVLPTRFHADLILNGENDLHESLRILRSWLLNERATEFSELAKEPF